MQESELPLESLMQQQGAGAFLCRGAFARVITPKGTCHRAVSGTVCW